MQFEVPDATAIDFSSAFYNALLSGEDVDGAVVSGRQAIGDEGIDWMVPVLYVSGDETKLFDFEGYSGPDSDDETDWTGGPADQVTPMPDIGLEGKGRRAPRQLTAVAGSHRRVVGAGRVAEEVREIGDAIASEMDDLWKELGVGRWYEAGRELSIPWRVNTELSVRWEALERAARREAEWERRARGRGGLDRLSAAAGRQGPPPASGEVTRFWEKVPTGWLVILGEKASGKSVLIRQVLGEMLDLRRKRRGGPCRCW